MGSLNDRRKQIIKSNSFHRSRFFAGTVNERLFMSNNKERNNKFADSLEIVTADELSDIKKKKRKLSEMTSDIMRYAFIVVCSVALIYSGVSITSALIGYSDQQEEYDKAENIINDSIGVQIMLGSPTMPTTPDYNASQNLTGADIEQYNPAPVNKEYERIKIKLSNIKEQYPNLYGWITIPGTSINYPIMQTYNNEYYLNHSYTGAKLRAGSIFADYKCDPTLINNRNLVIYGHHMLNYSMFYSLDMYLNESFFNSNNTVYIYTLDGMYTYKVFSVYETHKNFPYIKTSFKNDSSFVDFVQTIKGKSIHNNGAFSIDSNSKILTLSTCSNRTDEGRLAVHAVLTDIYETKKG